MGHPGLFFVFIFVFSNKQINAIKCASNIWCCDLNPQPSVHESHPSLTARLGLPLKNLALIGNHMLSWRVHFESQCSKRGKNESNGEVSSSAKWERGEWGWERNKERIARLLVTKFRENYFGYSQSMEL